MAHPIKTSNRRFMMKKNTALLLVIYFSIFLFVDFCYVTKLAAVKDSAPPKVSSKLSSTTRLRDFILKDGWFYFKDPENDYIFTKMKMDGSKKIPLTKTSGHDFFVQDGWIYYKNICNLGGGSTISRVKMDGTDKQLIYGRAAGDIHVDGEWIYFIDGVDDICVGLDICKVKTDGSHLECMGIKNVSDIEVKGDWIYYCLLPDRDDDDYLGYIYKMKKDGSSKTMICSKKGVFYLISVNEDWIYYYHSMKQFPSIDECNIEVIKTDGTGSRSILSYGAKIFVDNNTLYYVQDKQLYRFSRDMKKSKKVADFKDFKFIPSLIFKNNIIYYLDNQGQPCMINQSTGKKHSIGS